MNSRSIAMAYLAPLTLMAIVAFGSWLMGDTGATLFYKVLFAPFYLLAGLGLRTYFPEHLDATRSKSAIVQFQFLDAALVAGFIIVVTAVPGRELTPALVTFACLTLMIGTINILLIWHRQKGVTNKN